MDYLAAESTRKGLRGRFKVHAVPVGSEYPYKTACGRGAVSPPTGAPFVAGEPGTCADCATAIRRRERRRRTESQGAR